MNIEEVIKTVNKWARENDSTSYNYSSRMTFFRNAFHAGIITKEQYEASEKYYGRLWNYVGD
jgi:2-hydroxy-3-keto-5-methylthiopentenyl-1-phosphate phosphatase